MARFGIQGDAVTRQILAVLLDERGADVLEDAIRTAASSGSDTPNILLLRLYDTRYVERLCGKFREDGWMSGRQSEALGESLEASFKERLQTACVDMAQRLGEHQLEVTLLHRDGELVNTVLRTLETHAPIDQIVVAKPKPALLRRLFAGLNSRILADRAKCPVREVEWN